MVKHLIFLPTHKLGVYMKECVTAMTGQKRLMRNERRDKYARGKKNPTNYHAVGDSD